MSRGASGNFIPFTVNTPLDARQVVSTMQQISSIENPCIGGIFYCIENGKCYVITSLKSKQIGSMIVENAQVDSYKEIADKQNEITTSNFGNETYPEPSEWNNR